MVEDRLNPEWHMLVNPGFLLLFRPGIVWVSSAEVLYILLPLPCLIAECEPIL